MAAKTGRGAIDTVSRRTERLVTTYLTGPNGCSNAVLSSHAHGLTVS
jgi:hypothetical protein